MEQRESPRVAQVLERLLGGKSPIAIEAYDGSRAGPTSAGATLVVRSPDALRRMLTAPGQLGIGRAYVAGDLEIRGDVFEVLALQEEVAAARPHAADVRDLWRLVQQAGGLGRPLPPPPEEARVRGRRHSRRRDATAVTHHYDVSNDFYRLVLGPTMTYSCAVWETPEVGLDAAQMAKHDLVCRKLGLRPGMRLLDVGCGWGSLAMHAAAHYGVRATGITLSEEQAELARQRVRDAGLQGRVSVRVQDYRDVDDPAYDAISSIGMFEHVGRSQLATYFSRMHDLLLPDGRFLNHGISRGGNTEPLGRNGFIRRYVFPDGDLREFSEVVVAMQRAGFEIRHSENLREHYALTLRAWVGHLEEHLDEAVRLVGPGRTRVWRAYMAGSAMSFESDEIEIHQALAVRSDRGPSGMPLLPDW